MTETEAPSLPLGATGPDGKRVAVIFSRRRYNPEALPEGESISGDVLREIMNDGYVLSVPADIWSEFTAAAARYEMLRDAVLQMPRYKAETVLRVSLGGAVLHEAPIK